MSYTLLQQVNPQHAHFTFRGHFMDNDVLWDTQLLTVMEYARINNTLSGTARQFIEIKSTDTDIINLLVVLNVPEINPPVIQKMIIMINQYKKLSAGRHEYGDKIQLVQQQENTI